MKRLLLPLLMFGSILGLALALMGRAGSTIAYQAYPGPYPGPNDLVYLPITLKSLEAAPGSIFGMVTYQGNPMGSVALLLRFYDGANWSTRATAATDASGKYQFDAMPALAAGQLYYVRYENSTDDRFLILAATRTLAAYAMIDRVDLGSFDIADIVQTSPSPGAGLYTPANFSWNARPYSPTDSYVFSLFDPYYDDPYFYSIVGFTGNYTLNSRPAGFTTYHWYGWTVDVIGPGDAYGISYYYCEVYFMGGTGAMPGSAAVRRVPATNMLSAMIDPNTDRPRWLPPDQP